MQERKNVTYQEILDNIKNRDELDKTKKYGALQVPTDAIILNTDNLEIEQTVKNTRYNMRKDITQERRIE